MNTHTTQEMHKEHKKQYKKLLWMVILSFIAMYILMYSMVDTFANVIPNINQFYMAGLMTTAMIIIEIALMGSMYMHKKLNVLIIVISAVLLVAFYLFIRNQTGVSEKQFLKSMIPHHGAAILMVNKTEINDPEINKLANDIISSQQKEIELYESQIKRDG